MAKKQYKYHVSGCAPLHYPADTFFAVLDTPAGTLDVPKLSPFAGEWGSTSVMQMLDVETHPLPTAIDMVWLSVAEGKFYSLQSTLPTDDMEARWQQLTQQQPDGFESLVIGMAPYGGVAVWLVGEAKTELMLWTHAHEVNVDAADYPPTAMGATLQEICEFFLSNVPEAAEHLQKVGLPSPRLYDKRMAQYTYRFVPEFKHWDDEQLQWNDYTQDETLPQFDCVEQMLFDGTHDKLHDGVLLTYHRAGKPQRLMLQWFKGRSDYQAFFWFEEELLSTVFDRCYGAHGDTEVDFIIRMDVSQRRYEISLYREGMREPIIIPEAAYQLLLFRSGMESFRSDNFAQPAGACEW